jgi:hypothetical protein
MRPYRIVDEAYDEDDAYPRVVSIGGGGRNRATGLAGAGVRRPWTPRAGDPPPPARRVSPPPMLEQPGFSRTHRWMIASFVIVCVGMVLGMVMVRVWDEASRAVAALPPEGSAEAARQAPTPAPAPTAPPAGSAEQSASPQAAGAVTTEIQVLQPNYTVAPGDSLGIIARKHGTSVDALASINNLENRNSLSVGQKLIIP